VINIQYKLENYLKRENRRTLGMGVGKEMSLQKKKEKIKKRRKNKLSHMPIIGKR
jgi:hypothetical protein